MPIRVKCGNCKKTLSVKDHLAGKKIKCPVCQTVVTVPTAPPTKAPLAAAGVKKPVAKPGPTTKPGAEPPESNGAPPVVNKAKSNGTATPPPDLETIELPPENIEAEAASAFADEPKPA